MINISNKINTYGNIISFDFGLKNIGVAVGQLITCTAHPVKMIKMKNSQINWEEIELLIQEWNPNKIVIGLPKNIDGEEQLPLSKLARNFANKVYSMFNIRIFFHDERFSTVEARHRLFSHGGYRSLKKDMVNSISAAIILEGWFDSILVKNKKQYNNFIV